MGSSSWQKKGALYSQGALCGCESRVVSELRIPFNQIWLREVLMTRILLELFLHIGVRVVLAVEPPSAVLEAVDSAHAAGEEESGASVNVAHPSP